MLYAFSTTAQTFEFKTLVSLVGASKDSVESTMFTNGWSYQQKTDNFTVFSKPTDHGIDILGIYVKYDVIINVSYNIPSSYAHLLEKEISYQSYIDSTKLKGSTIEGYKMNLFDKFLLVYFDYEYQENQCLIQLELKEPYSYYSMEECKKLINSEKYSEVLPSLLHLKEEYEHHYPLDLNKYTEVVYMLDYVYVYTDGFDKSLNVLKHCFEFICEKSDSCQSSHTRKILAKIGERNVQLKQYDEAESMYDLVEEYYQEANDYGLSYMLLQSQKSVLYVNIKDTIKLRDANEKVINIYKKFYGNIYESNGKYALMLLNNIALSYYHLGEFQKAEQAYKHIIEKSTNNSIHSITDYIYACSNLAILYMKEKRWKEALSLIEPLTVRSNYLKEQFLDLLLIGYLFTNNKSKTTEYFDDFLTFYQSKLSKILFDLNPEKYENTWFESNREILLLNFIPYKSNDSKITIKAYEKFLFYKNGILNREKLISQCVNNSSDYTLKEIFIKYNKLKNNMIFNTDEVGNYEDSYWECENLYDSIINKISSLKYVLQSEMPIFEKLKATLSDNEYIIDLCILPIYDGLNVEEYFYGAYIIDKNSKAPRLIKLFNFDSIKQYIPNTYSDELFFSERYSQDETKKLYNLFFKPIEQVIKNKRNSTIYYSPCGNLSLLNVDLLTDDIGKPLNEKYKMIRVSSTADIQSAKSSNITSSSAAAIFGNVNFDSAFYESSRGHIFGRLKYAKKEISSIVSILKGSNIYTDVFEDKAATEQAFKNLSGHSPEILHIATHGFCFETDEKAADKPFAKNINTYSQKESAMVLCGLALSGANNVWKGNFENVYSEDGILTAYEIYQLDLSNTKLVVLSACETARGKIFPVDGVFGLQRAFKQAGAGAILMSLWKVDDGVTSIFMEHFYKFLFETNDRHKALKLAQDEVKKQFPDPYYWAAWVMLD